MKGILIVLIFLTTWQECSFCQADTISPNSISSIVSNNNFVVNNRVDLHCSFDGIDSIMSFSIPIKRTLFKVLLSHDLFVVHNNNFNFMPCKTNRLVFEFSNLRFYRKTPYSFISLASLNISSNNKVISNNIRSCKLIINMSHICFYFESVNNEWVIFSFDGVLYTRSSIEKYNKIANIGKCHHNLCYSLMSQSVFDEYQKYWAELHHPR
ncbi:MAG: hypothetical protein AB7V36_06730 [Bacteroidales bacterium]